ncbi:MAG: organic hydroperoxide resistance protein [Lautropia sp.]
MTTKLEKIFYTATAHTTGGREGTSRTDDGRLEVTLSAPGTAGVGTNPEQLFAVGYAACFLSALQAVAAARKVTLPENSAIDSRVDLGKLDRGYAIAATLNVILPGVARETAQDLIDAAHRACPYSKAIRGNVEVTINLV